VTEPWHKRRPKMTTNKDELLDYLDELDSTLGAGLGVEDEMIPQLKRIVQAYFAQGQGDESILTLIDKINDEALAISCKWHDPMLEIREIWKACNKAKKLLSQARPIPSSPIKVTREWEKEEYGYLLDQIQEEYFRLHGSVGMEKFMFILNDKLWTFLIEELGVEVEDEG